MNTWRKAQIQVEQGWDFFFFAKEMSMHNSAQTDPRMYAFCHACVSAWQYSYRHIVVPLFPYAYTPKGLILDLMSSRPVCVCCVCFCMCTCVRTLSGRPSNTLSLGGSLIYKASNEVQQRRRARTSPRLIVCLFTFLFHFFFHVQKGLKKTTQTWVFMVLL